MKTILKAIAFLSIALISSAVGQQISGGGGSTSPGGSTTQLQYNNAGALGGTGAIIYLDANKILKFDSTGSGAVAQSGLLLTDGSSGNTSMLIGASVNQVISAQQNALGQSYRIVGDTTGSGGGAAIVGGSGFLYQWQSTARSDSGSADTGIARNAAGIVEINNGIAGSLAALKLTTLTATTLATDATHTDNSVCVDSSSGLFYKGSGTIGICLGTSSMRFKHDIVPQTDGLDQIKALLPVNYRYNKGYGDDGAKQQYGFLAEDVVKVAPKLVGLDADGRPNSVDIVGIVPILVKAVQELQAEVDALKKTKRADLQ